MVVVCPKSSFDIHQIMTGPKKTPLSRNPRKITSIIVDSLNIFGKCASVNLKTKNSTPPPAPQTLVIPESLEKYHV